MDNADENGGRKTAIAAMRRRSRQDWLQTWVFPLLRLMFPAPCGWQERPALLRIDRRRPPGRR